MFNPLQSRTLGISGAALPTWAGGPVLTPTRLVGTEKLGRLYEYTVEVMTVESETFRVWQAKELVSTEALVGKELVISIDYEGKGTFIPGLPGGLGSANIGAGTREITGLITGVRCTGADDRHAYYQLTVRPWLWLATLNRDNRIFQNQNVVEITESILKEKRYPFRYDLRLAAPGFRGIYPKRDYVRQCWESDFQFLSRLWREWGLYFFMDGATLVLCDSPGSHRRHGPAYETISYHAPGGKRIDEEHIHRLAVSCELTAGVVTLTDYDYTRSRANLGASVDDASDMTFANAEHYGWGDYSQPQASTMGLSGEANNIQREAEHLARVRLDGERCRSLRARGRGNLRGLATGLTFHLENHPVSQANAEYLVVSTTVDIRNVDETSRPAGDGAQYQCETEFVLQPANTFFRNRQKKRPRCAGETAIVVGPGDQPMWVDGYARVKVQFIWDRLGNNDQNSSIWLRVSSPWQGNGYGTIYLPRIGQEITVSYHDDDPDRPYVSDRMVNQFNQPPWTLPGNQALSGTRTQEINGAMSNSFVADDTTGKPQVQVTSDYANSRLVLGYNTRIVGNAGRKEARGQGWELATDAWGVARASQGMLITTESREGATTPMKDMGETVQRLTAAHELQESLLQQAQYQDAQQAGTDQSEIADALKAQNDAIHGVTGTGDNTFPELSGPQLVLASAASTALTAQQSTHIASNEHLALTTGLSVGIATGKSLVASIRERFSVFVQRMGITLIAAAGKISFQAKTDGMSLLAHKLIEIISERGGINLKTPNEITLNAGGTQLTLNASGAFIHTKGQCLIHCADFDTPGPEEKPVNITTKPHDEQFTLINKATGKPLSSAKYKIVKGSGETIEGVTDAEGKTMRVVTNGAEQLVVHLIH